MADRLGRPKHRVTQAPLRVSYQDAQGLGAPVNRLSAARYVSSRLSPVQGSVPMSSIRALLVDEWEVIRRGLRDILEIHGSMQVVAEADDIDDVVRLACGVMPDVVLMDLTPPYDRFLDAVHTLHKETGAACVAFTDVAERRIMNAWLDAGGKGYLPKTAGSQEIVHCVRHVAEGKTYVSPLLIQQHKDEATSRRDGLSHREREIAILVAKGYTSHEISVRLHISQRTVENHRNRIKRRLGIGSRAELVTYVTERGLLHQE
jgi:DNA-binding NarL/FixJ family response regulator